MSREVRQKAAEAKVAQARAKEEAKLKKKEEAERAKLDRLAMAEVAHHLRR